MGFPLWNFLPVLETWNLAWPDHPRSATQYDDVYATHNLFSRDSTADITFQSLPPSGTLHSLTIPVIMGEYAVHRFSRIVNESLMGFIRVRRARKTDELRVRLSSLNVTQAITRLTMREHSISY